MISGVVTTYIAMASCALICGVLVLQSVLRFGRSTLGRSIKARAAILATVVAASLLPIDGLSIAIYLRGLTGDISITSMVLLCVWAVALVGGRPVLFGREKAVLALILAATALLLYPMSLGLSNADPYALGYDPLLLGAVVFLVSVAGVATGHHIIAISMVGALLGFSFRVLESPNLWDYLVDPWVATYGIIIVLKLMVGRAHLHPASVRQFMNWRK